MRKWPLSWALKSEIPIGRSGEHLGKFFQTSYQKKVLKIKIMSYYIYFHFYIFCIDEHK